MKIFDPLPATLTRFYRHRLPATALLSLPLWGLFAACAGPDHWLRQAASPLTIEVAPSSRGPIKSTRVFETADRLYVAGTADSFTLPPSAHLDVELIGTGGRVIAEQHDKLDDPGHPQTATGRTGRSTFVASFPLEEARQASKIRVDYHGEPHPKS